jgi:hypothetical protein
MSIGSDGAVGRQSPQIYTTGPLGYGLPLRGFEPFIKSTSIAADIGTGGPGHFQTAARV